jgi:hypothetical protein
MTICDFSMGQPDAGREPASAGPPGSALAPAEGQGDQRKAKRFVLLIRSAKLVCDSGEFLCIVRDVSQSGAKLRLFHPIPSGEHCELELATGERFALEHRWNRDGQFGFRFHSPIDVPRFIAEAGPYPRRPVRLRITAPGCVVVQGSAIEAQLCDLSRHGARIETAQPLAIGQKLKLRVAGLPTIEAAVCWRDAPAYGLVFPRGFTFEELARLAWTMQTGLPLAEGSGGADWLVATA